MRIINLSSGSDGNLTYFEDGDKKILLDVGLSCTETLKRLELIKINPKDLTAILITHEHNDHIKGLDIFASKFNIPVYAHDKVWQGLEEKLKKVSFSNRKRFDGPFCFEETSITPIHLPHDVECFGYSFSHDDKKISVVTDLGHLNDNILHSLKGSQIVYIESNYDRQMLLSGTKYPLTLKRRIDGPNGHLSNLDCATGIEFLAKTGTRQIILSHLSKENNTPSLAYNTIKDKIANAGIIEGVDIKIDVASTNPGTFFRLK